MHHVKNTCNYKDLPLRGTHWCIKYLTERIYNDYNNVVCYFEIFNSCQGSLRTFSKHYSKCKTVSIKFRKTLQVRKLPTSKFSQDNPQNNFFSFLTSKNIFGTDIRRMFLKYSGKITSWLLEFGKRSTLFIIKSYTFNTKELLHREHFKNSFPLKCSLNFLWMS